jgi:hypothetical protein
MSYNDVKSHLMIPSSLWMKFLISDTMVDSNLIYTSEFQFGLQRSVTLTFNNERLITSPLQKKFFRKELPKVNTNVALKIQKRNGTYMFSDVHVSQSVIKKIERFLESEGPIWDQFGMDVLDYLQSLSFYDALCLRQYQGGSGYTVLNRFLRGEPIKQLQKEQVEYFQWQQTIFSQVIADKDKKALWRYLDGIPFYLSAQYGQDDTKDLLKYLNSLSPKQAAKLITKEKLEQWASDLNRIILGAPKLPKDLVVFRGTRFEKPNVDPLRGFTSVSTDFNLAQGFSNGECCIDVYTLPEGLPVFLLLREDEIILPSFTTRIKVPKDKSLLDYLLKLQRNLPKGFWRMSTKASNVKFYEIEMYDTS